MAKAIVTQERVFEVAQELKERKIDPTITNVQTEIGGGSYSTVKRYLDLWKVSVPLQAIELPPAAVDRLMALGRDFWALLDAKATQRIEYVTAIGHGEKRLLQDQLDQAEQAIGQLEIEKEQGETAFNALQQDNQRLRESNTTEQVRSEQLEMRVEELKAELERMRMEQQGLQDEAKAMAVESGKLQGEVTTLRSQVHQIQGTLVALGNERHRDVLTGHLSHSPVTV